jgi:hypothetical protein
MIGYIISLDQFLLHLVNGVWVSPVLDRLMPALSAAGNLGDNLTKIFGNASLNRGAEFVSAHENPMHTFKS